MSVGRTLRELTLGEWLLIVLAAGTIAAHLLVPRDMSLGESEFLSETAGDHLGYSIARVVTAAVLGLGALGIAASLRGRLPASGVALYAAYLGWFGANFVVNAIGRDTPEGWTRAFYHPVLMGALLLTPAPSRQGFLRTAKWLLLAFVYAALVGAAVAPDIAVAQRYESLIPGVDFRLYGIGGGPISLASCGLVYVLLELCEPSRGPLRYVHLLAAAAVVVLAQSKTAWVFALLCGAVAAVAAVERRTLRLPRARLFGPVQLAALGVALAAYLLAGGGPGSALDLAAREGGEGLSTATGRTWIWEVSLALFLEHPLRGYGPALWAEPQFLATYGQFAHAHNQWLQAMAGAGLVGLLGLAGYVAVLVRRSASAASFTFAPAAVVAWTLFQGMTEVPLRAEFLLDVFVILHAILAMTVLVASSPDEVAAAAPGPAALVLDGSVPP